MCSLSPLDTLCSLSPGPIRGICIYPEETHMPLEGMDPTFSGTPTVCFQRDLMRCLTQWSLLCNLKNEKEPIHTEKYRCLQSSERNSLLSHHFPLPASNLPSYLSPSPISSHLFSLAISTEIGRQEQEFERPWLLRPSPKLSSK